MTKTNEREVTAKTANSIRSALMQEAKTLREEGRNMIADDLLAFAKAARSEELVRFRDIVVAA